MLTTEAKKLTINEVIHSIGGLGTWQLLIYAYLGWNIFFGAAINMSIVFLQYAPKATCVVPEINRFSSSQIQKLSSILTSNTSECQRLDVDLKQFGNRSFGDVYDYLESQHTRNYTTCDAWIFDKSVMKSSIVSDWHLICGNGIEIANTNLVYVVGYLCGTFTSGLISDRLGRSRTVAYGYVFGALMGVIMCEMTHFSLFLLFRFLLAYCINAAYSAAYVTGIEITTTQYRQLIGCLAYVPYSSGYVLLAGIAYATRDWRSMHLIIVVPLFINIVGIFLLPESPRWLVSKGRIEEAKVILRRAAKLNGVKDDSFLDVDIEYNAVERSDNFFHIFKYPTLVLRAAILCFLWFVNALVYYGISYNVTSFVGDIFANNAICGLVEFPSYLLSYFFGTYWGRNKPICLALLICGSSLIPIPFVSSGAGTMGLAMLGKLFTTTAFTILYIYTNELYPTVIRAAGFSLSSVVGRIGSISGPYILLVGTTNPSLKAFPMIFFGVLSIAAGLATLILPETRKKRLPNYLEEALKFENEDEIIYTTPKPNYGATDDSDQIQLIPTSDSDGKI